MKTFLEVLLIILIGAILVLFIAAVIAGIIAIGKLSVLLLVGILGWSKFWSVLGAAGIVSILLSAGSSSATK